VVEVIIAMKLPGTRLGVIEALELNEAIDCINSGLKTAGCYAASQSKCKKEQERERDAAHPVQGGWRDRSCQSMATRKGRHESSAHLPHWRRRVLGTSRTGDL
jgi:hypothetical protein